MELTFDEAIKKHRELWNIVVKLLEDGIEYSYIDDYKKEALNIMNEKDIPFEYCYCCEYVSQSWLMCDSCILKWGNSECSDSEYLDMMKALKFRDYDEALRLAKIIRDLPERR